MSFNKYYQDELVALRELGSEFSLRNPGLAPFLATPGRDPDVERLLEGFAFLSGRLRQKLDDELPEITHALFNLLWPNYLRPVPSASVLQYVPAPGLSGNLHIPKGTKVTSKRVDGMACTFQTVYGVEVAPLRLADLEFREDSGRAVLGLSFRTLGVPLSNLGLERLRLFLVGEPSVTTILYFIFLKKVTEIQAAYVDGDGVERTFMTLGAEALEPVGFRESEAMYIYPANTFSGYRLMQEYFCFPEKFLFVELGGLGELNQRIPEKYKDVTAFKLLFRLKERPEQAELFKKDNIRLFCTPVVNLFRLDATPILMDHRQTEYRIVPDPRNPFHYAVYNVDKVSSWLHEAKKEVDYVPFESFEHGQTPGSASAFYRLRLKPSVHDQATETFISVVHLFRGAPLRETVSLELTVTNRLLAQRLELGDICRPSDNTPEHVTFSNITPVSGSYAPPLESDLLWRLISNMSLNYIPLIDVQALRTVISAYDFRALHDKTRARAMERALNGLVRVSSFPTDRVYQGLPLRGSKTTLTLNQEAFNGEGDMYLFGSIINEFLALYATVNSFHELTVTEEKRGETYRWPARLGMMKL
ncbi:MAG: type VI secretion system baseplate subunit TssF [Deltaproteobacteria bacterium]|jgi:type VI secretion system protein ImpG|nr:type VI secretion system baseplate subunit TssF [Deltaproteobacteria bacterium]